MNFAPGFACLAVFLTGVGQMTYPDVVYSGENQMPNGAIVRIGTSRFRPGEPLLRVRVSPDDKTIASLSISGRLHIWDSETGALLRSVPFADGESWSDIAFSMDGGTMAAAGMMGRVTIWTFPDFGQRRIVPCHDGVENCICFSMDGTRVISAGTDEMIRITRVVDGRIEKRIPTPGRTIEFVCFSPDGKLFASVDNFAQVTVWRWSSCEPIKKFGPKPKRPSSPTYSSDGCSFSRDGKQFLLATNSASTPLQGRIWVWDIKSESRVRVLKHAVPIYCFAYADDKFAAGTYGGEIVVWSLDSPLDPVTLSGHSGAVSHLAFFDDGDLLASGGRNDCTIRVWNVTKRAEKSPSESRGIPRGPVIRLHFAPDGSSLLVASDRFIRKYHRKSGKLLAKSEADDVLLDCATFSPNGKIAATASEAGELRLWDLTTWRELKLLSPESKKRVSALGFSPDASRLAESAYNRQLRVWDIGTGAVIIDEKGSQTFNGLCFSNDGRRIAAGSRHGFFILDANTGDVLLEEEAIYKGDCAAASPANDLVATDMHRSMRLWDVKALRELRPMQGRFSIRAPRDCAFSFRGDLLAAAATEGLMVWHVASGDQVCKVDAHRGGTTCVAFSKDGQLIATGGSDSCVLVWDVKKLIAEQHGK